jgi:hypothetical protein
LWEAVLELIENEQPTRARVLQRFEHDGNREVIAVLNDLVRSGLVFMTGTGDGAVYGVTSEAMRDRLVKQHDLDSVANIAWLKVFRGEVERREELIESLGVDRELARAAVDELVGSGRVTEQNGALKSSNVVLALGSEQGWEAAVLDHYRTVAVAIGTKVRAGFGASDIADRIGGSTFTFTVTPGHPYESDVYELLRKTRVTAQALWDKIAAYNEEQPPDPERSTRFSFYVGQTLEIAED